MWDVFLFIHQYDFAYIQNPGIYLTLPRLKGKQGEIQINLPVINQVQMNQNESSDSKNEFMNSSSDMNSLAKIMQFTKEIMKNPSMMQEMQRRLNQKQSINNSTFVKGMNSETSNNSIINSSILQQQSSFRNNQSQMPKSQPMNKKSPIQQQGRKKGTDVLSQYLSNPIQNSKNYQEQNQQQALQLHNPVANNTKQTQKLTTNNAYNDFQDKPIQSSYATNKIADPDSIYQVDDPAAYQQDGKFNGSSFVAKKPQAKKRNPIKAQEQQQPHTHHQNSSNAYIEAQQRPICGIKKDFKDHLKEQYADMHNPLENLEHQHDQNDDEQNGYAEQAAPKKQFLKRGSRQHLSSAKDKKEPIKKPRNNANMNSSRLDDERSKTPIKRQVSQNRVLGRRNNQKSQTKINNKKIDISQNQSYVEGEESYNDQPPRRSITPKNQRGQNKIKTSAVPPQPAKRQAIVSNKSAVSNSGASSAKKRHAKNVFDDSSSSQIEEDEQKAIDSSHAKSRTNNHIEPKQYDKFSRQKKIEFIEGVFLTKTQINVIKQKLASQIQQATKPQAQEKFNELRRKYTDLCSLVQKQKIEQEDDMQRQREKFEQFKQAQVLKIKNQKRVMERQLKSTMPSHGHNSQKDKQQVQNLKKQLQKQKDDHRKREKNNKILIQKYKKQTQELKQKLERAEQDLQKSAIQGKFNNHIGSFAALDKRNIETSKSQQQSVKNDRSKSKSGVTAAKKQGSKSPSNICKKERPAADRYSDDEGESNYKKTVPFKSQKAATQYGSGDCKVQEDEQLPTFNVNNNKKQEKKKYQFVEVENKQNNQPKKPASTASKSVSKNVFINSPSDYSDSGSDSYEGGIDEGNFFKSGPNTNTNRYDSLQAIAQSQSFSIKDVTAPMIEKLFRFNTNKQYREYMERINNPKRQIQNSSKSGTDKKITNIYSDRSKEVLFENGVKKQIFQDGYTIIYFKNGDIKQKLADGSIIYYFKEKQVDQITLNSGLNIYRFDNNQVELHFDAGKYIQIRHPDGTIKILGGGVTR